MKPRSLTVRVNQFGNLVAHVSGRIVADECSAYVLALTLTKSYKLNYALTLAAIQKLNAPGDVWRTKIFQPYA